MGERESGGLTPEMIKEFDRATNLFNVPVERIETAYFAMRAKDPEWQALVSELRTMAIWIAKDGCAVPAEWRELIAKYGTEA